MSDDKKVVFLAFRNDTPTVTEEVLSCKICENKTWKAVYDNNSGFPDLRCACCGQHLGRFGWVEEDK